MSRTKIHKPTEMYYGSIKNFDIANGIGVRVSLFVSGCTNHCPGCFQPETWSFTYGEPFTEATEQTLIDMLSPEYIRGLTLLGGDPMEPENQRVLLPFLRKVKLACPRKDIWAFTGYVYEDLCRQGSKPNCEATDELMSLIDVLVDGPFIEADRDISLRFRGSSNQRMIDLRRTQTAGRITLWEG